MSGIVLGILMFMFLVLIHEFGHFLVAKKKGVKVLEFGIGIPPKVCNLRKDKSGTQYTLNLLPLGGFVRLKGEDPSNEEEFHAKDSFIKAKVRNKILILIAGVGMNFLVARFLFSLMFFLGTKPISLLPENALKAQSHSYLMPTLSFLQAQGFTSGDITAIPPKIEEVIPGGIGAAIGLKSGDVLLSVNNESVNIINIGDVLKKHIGKSINIDYQRGGITHSLNGECNAEDCLLGISFALSGDFSIKDIKFPLGASIWAGLKEIGAETNLTLVTLGTLGRNLVSFNGTKIKNTLNGLVGPVGAVKFGQTLLNEGGLKLFLAFAGMISLALAIFNILPLPALDGGRFRGVIIQWIGRLKPEKYFIIESYINLVFFILLMGLGIYIILKDLIRFRAVKIPFLS